MTENEAIEALRLINTSRVHPFYSWEEMAEVRDIAISALKEIQQYRKIGTVEECREAREKQIPTAFDKEKVIEQIKVLSAGIILNTNISDDYAEGYVRAAKDIIEIIEKGGIE